MSRLHRQKLRLRAAQRQAGVIDPASDDIDRDAFEEVGTGPKLDELGAKIAEHREAEQAASKTESQPVTPAEPAQTESAPQTPAPAPAEPAQNPAPSVPAETAPKS